jgi:sensor histidine kinase YesM
VVRTLSRLSDLLRIALDRNLPQEIPLARELEILEGYLDIQSTRFGDRLAVVRDIDTDARDCLLPSMLLQPLVENALQHGIESRPGPGRVTLMVRRDADTLRIRVEDTGPGFPAAERTHENGIGLSNTRARLEQLYGAAQSLECGDVAGGGGFVQVRLPYHSTSRDGGSA